ncbi:MAG: hypothetical protein ACKO72_07480 [Actinomycetes bacterium]
MRNRRTRDLSEPRATEAGLLFAVMIAGIAFAAAVGGPQVVHLVQSINPPMP